MSELKNESLKEKNEKKKASFIENKRIARTACT